MTKATLPVYVTFTEYAKLTKFDGFDCKERWFTSNDRETPNEFSRMSDVQYVLNKNPPQISNVFVERK